MFAIKFSIEKQINFFWTTGFFLPAINATVFSRVDAFLGIKMLKPFSRFQSFFCYQTMC
jgi:hypothetical protein